MAGILPINQVASFTPTQQDALTQIATTYAPARGYMQGAADLYGQARNSAPPVNNMFGQAQDFYSRAGQYLNQGTQQFTPEQYTQGVQGFMNPYTNEVVNNASNDIARQAAILRTGAGGTGGMASNFGAFGSDRQGVVDSSINRDALQQTGNVAGQLRYQGFNDASNNYLNQFNQNNANNLSAAGLSGQMGGALNSAGLTGFNSLGNMALTGTQLQANNQQNWYAPQLLRLRAGNQIQQQNQNVLNAINGSQTAPTTYLANAANPFLSGANETASSPSSLSTLGGYMNVGAGIANQFPSLNNIFG